MVQIPEVNHWKTKHVTQCLDLLKNISSYNIKVHIDIFSSQIKPCEKNNKRKSTSISSDISLKAFLIFLKYNQKWSISQKFSDKAVGCNLTKYLFKMQDGKSKAFKVKWPKYRVTRHFRSFVPRIGTCFM